MKPLLAVILLLLGPQNAETVDHERLARAVAAESQNAPRSPDEWGKLLLLIGRYESGFKLRIIDGHCRPNECDRGRAKGGWQLWRNTLNRDSWAKQDGDIELQAHLASEQLKRAFWQCHKSGIPWLVGTLNAYAGLACNNDKWPGLRARLETYRRIR